MTAEQFVAIMSALTALLIAVAQLWRAVAAYHKTVNGRIDQLIELTALAARAEGRLEGPIPRAQ